jgi:hypothetical protein
MNVAALRSFHQVEDSAEVNKRLVRVLRPKRTMMTRWAVTILKSFLKPANVHMIRDVTALSPKDLAVSNSMAVSVRGLIACFLLESAAAGEKTTTCVC